ncbi:MAG: 2-oxoacid:acceptor oxidoreductase family protein [Candidatus Aenigmarchaeota archaeon]|nr:2-oxoacid:acceptor oxidoreductase family protein [Candidatus Aenigmarchaeota archaeon]
MKQVSPGLVEVVIYGRGGQGAKTAGEVLAEAAILEGKFAQAFPEYGPERRGAPTRAFVRISGKEIRTHEPILKPNYVLVLDRTLLGLIETKDAVGIINSPAAENHFRENYTIDASKISCLAIGKDVPNTVLAGAFAKVSGAIGLDALLKVTEKVFGKKFDHTIIEKNLGLVKSGFEKVEKV